VQAGETQQLQADRGSQPSGGPAAVLASLDPEQREVALAAPGPVASCAGGCGSSAV